MGGFVRFTASLGTGFENVAHSGALALVEAEPAGNAGDEGSYNPLEPIPASKIDQAT